MSETYSTKGWHPDPATDREALLELMRDEIKACKAEIDRLREELRRAQED